MSFVWVPHIEYLLKMQSTLVAVTPPVTVTICFSDSFYTRNHWIHWQSATVTLLPSDLLLSLYHNLYWEFSNKGHFFLLNSVQGDTSPGEPRLVWPWFGMFHHLAQLLSQFCQIPISPGRTGQRVEQPKSKSTKPSLSSLGTPCRPQAFFFVLLSGNHCIEYFRAHLDFGCWKLCVVARGKRCGCGRGCCLPRPRLRPLGLPRHLLLLDRLKFCNMFVQSSNLIILSVEKTLQVRLGFS